MSDSKPESEPIEPERRVHSGISFAKHQSVRVAFETARLQLAEIRNAGAGARRTAYEIACRLSANTLGVERVSVWRLLENNAGLACQASYRRGAGDYESGTTLMRASCPNYFDAVLSRRVVVANDALTHPKTAELGDYLRGLNIGALLDAPIYRDGVVIGVVCHEHCGGPRQWTEKEAEFASAVADMLTILVEQAERAELRAALEAERHAQARAEKMAALQRLARIATHDLNNVLTVAMARSDLIKQGIDPPAMSQEVTQVLSYGAKLVRQLSEFCEERTSSQTVDLRELLRGLEPALRALLGKEVSLQLKIDDTSLLVPIAPVEAEQLILNLCMNASDAITPPGEIRIILSRDSTNDNVLLEIMDSGIGMDEGTQTRIFEPYFSTKSNHSGVGLMAVYGIVQRAGGAIELQSAPGAGTRFRIIIPSSSASAPDQEPPWSFE